MNYDQAVSVLNEKKNMVFIGESGSGKTEVSLNFAVALAAGPVPVHFFDMDQTKPLFRARDSASVMEAFGITVHYQEQLLDLPTLVPSVNERLTDKDIRVVMDVGGSVHGARMIGQFSSSLNGGDAEVIFIVNPYRPWTGDPEGIRDAVARVTSGCRIENVRLACNPALGLETTADEAVTGSKMFAELLGKTPDFTLAREEIADEVSGRVQEPVLPLKIYVRYPWQK